jgi:uracil-DNA glycosylase
MVGPPVHGAAIETPLFLLGQAPGPHEAKYGRPFAYTAGRTLFRWFEEATGVGEVEFREHVYMAAVARCFPGKGSGGGDRVPNPQEISNCSRHLRAEIEILEPKLFLAIGRLAIAQILGPKIFPAGALLTAVVGKKFQCEFQGHATEVICLPHPSGLSSWPKVEPGKTLLKQALDLVAHHPAWLEVFGSKQDRT